MRSKFDSLASFTSEDSDSAQKPSSKKIKLDEESDLLSDYKTAIVSPNVSDTRHELEQYLSLPVTDSTMLRSKAIVANFRNWHWCNPVASNTCYKYCKWASVFGV